MSTRGDKVLQQGAAALRRPLPVRNREDGLTLPADEHISTDFLQLVRFGLRLADDPLILDSLTVVDHLLKIDTLAGPVCGATTATAMANTTTDALTMAPGAGGPGPC